MSSDTDIRVAFLPSRSYTNLSARAVSTALALKFLYTLSFNFNYFYMLVPSGGGAKKDGASHRDTNTYLLLSYKLLSRYRRI
jgi:hypothetical protein